MDINQLGQLKYLKLSEVGPTNGLVGWLKLVNNSSEYSGYQNTTTLNGTIITSLGAKFNYTTDYISYNIPTGLNQNSISVSAWVKSDDITKAQNILSRNGPIFLRITGSTFRFCIFTNSTWTFVNGVIPLQSNTWIHLVGVYDGSYMKGYVNGVLDINTVKTGTLTSSTLGVYNIGYTTGGEDAPFGGYIKDLRIYNCSLTSEEVNILYNIGTNNSQMQMSDDGTLYISNELREV